MHDDIGRARRPDMSKDLWSEGEQIPRNGLDQPMDRFSVELTAAVIALNADQPVVLVRTSKGGDTTLPSEVYHPAMHRALEDAIRARVASQTGLELGYVEQLLTDCDDGGGRNGQQEHQLSIGYLALIRVEGCAAKEGEPWISCYDFLPWEDWRRGRPSMLSALEPQLLAWAADDPDSHEDADAREKTMSRAERVRIMFGLDGAKWDDERVVERLEILDDAGLANTVAKRTLRADHRRILGTALARLRAKIRSRPLVFELLPPVFTLFELQKTVEAILGPHLHKQNFRRLVEGTGLVEPTGDVRTHTGGRPAKLFRFRREVLLERPAPGVRIKAGRAA